MPRGLPRVVKSLLNKARESALLAVETYNRPGTVFRSRAYIVLMQIAWTSLFLAIFHRQGMKPYYRKKNSRRFEKVDGERKAWDLTECIRQYWKDHDNAVAQNLRFFIRLRNKIEHRDLPELDIEIFGECQSLLFNFEDVIEREFGAKHALNESLAISLQFSRMRNAEKNKSIREMMKPIGGSVADFIQQFRSALSDDIFGDMAYSYRVFLLPNIGSHRSRDSVAIEFVPYDPFDPEDVARYEKMTAILKERHVPVVNPGKYFEGIVADYVSFSQEQTCYVPLAGINITMDVLPFGKIILKKMTDALTEEVAQKIESIIMLSTNTEEQKKEAAKSIREMIKTLHGTICAEFIIVAEQRRARERAEEETRRVIDLILYSIPALYQRELRVTTGLFGEVSFVSRITPIIASDERRFSVDIYTVGPLTNFDLTPGHIKHMERIGVFKVADILKKSDKILTNFESTILRGIHWFASSQSQYEQENEFLNLVTCLEAFLTPTDRDPIANAVAEGVAMLISDDLESRKIIKKRIKYFYGIRSGISHGGQKAVLDVEIAELKKMTGTLIIRLIDRVGELESQRQLLEWIEDQRLGK